MFRVHDHIQCMAMCPEHESQVPTARTARVPPRIPRALATTRIPCDSEDSENPTRPYIDDEVGIYDELRIEDELGIYDELRTDD
jgi:hypothetical protein